MSGLLDLSTTSDRIRRWATCRPSRWPTSQRVFGTQFRSQEL